MALISLIADTVAFPSVACVQERFRANQERRRDVVGGSIFVKKKYAIRGISQAE